MTRSLTHDDGARGPEGETVRITRPKSSPPLADWLLVILALLSSLWALWNVSGSTNVRAPSTMLLSTEAFDSEPDFFVDETNVIHWDDAAADGAMSFAFSRPEVSEEVFVVVHPDSLMEPLLRMVTVLRQAGVLRVRLACADSSPFPEDTQAETGREK